LGKLGLYRYRRLKVAWTRSDHLAELKVWVGGGGGSQAFWWTGNCRRPEAATYGWCVRVTGKNCCRRRGTKRDAQPRKQLLQCGTKTNSFRGLRYHHVRVRTIGWAVDLVPTPFPAQMTRDPPLDEALAHCGVAAPPDLRRLCGCLVQKTNSVPFSLK
jgi:hypothetical protein